MQFLFPTFLFALAAIAIPIIIHLFNFRRFKTVYFSNVAFLREVKEETAARSRLKHLLVLAVRVLAITFLVFAFAQPFIPKKNTNIATGKKYVSVYIDNSFSMGAMSSGVRLIDRAKQAAKEIVQNYTPEDKFQLLTNELKGKHQRLLSKEEFLSMLDEVDISPAARTLSEITRRQADALSIENSHNKVAYLLTDFQKNMGDFYPDTTVRYNLLPLAADAQQNIFVDTAWFTEPIQLIHQAAKLIVRIKNTGEKANEGNRLLLKLNGQTKGIADFNVDAGSYAYDTIRFTINQAGWNKAELSIQDFPITYDDTYFFSYSVAEKIKVLAINEGKANSYVDALFKNQPEFDYSSTPSSSLDYSRLKGNQLVLLTNLNALSSGLSAGLLSFLADGGSIALFPALPADRESYQKFLSSIGVPALGDVSTDEQDLAPINLRQNIFKDVFDKVPDNMSLPKVKKYYHISPQATIAAEDILALKKGSSYLTKYTYKTGALYLCASPLDRAFTDLPIHAIFAPMLYRMAIVGNHNERMAYTIGDKGGIDIASKGTSHDKVYKIKGKEVEFIPAQTALGSRVVLGLKDQIQKSGFYQVSLENSDSADIIALNYDRNESALTFFKPAELKEKYNQSNINIATSVGVEVAQVIKEMDRGIALWKACLILALLFLGVEALLLRF